VDAILAPQRRYSNLLRKIYAIFGAFFGFFLASYTGVLLAHTHLPVWANTPVLGALFAASAASTGMAAIALGLALTRVDVSGSWAKLKQADNAALILELGLLIVFLVWLGSAAMPILTGLNGILLMGGTVLAGLLFPLVLQFRSGFQNDKTGVGPTMLAALLILIGGFLMRIVIVMGGQGLL
jgi:protein NrfD